MCGERLETYIFCAEDGHQDDPGPESSPQKITRHRNFRFFLDLHS